MRDHRPGIRAAWIAIALICLLRAVAAFTLPLTGDEAYYWEWSRRPAFGYVDHPPMVAWTIALFSWLGHTPGFVRLGFVVCGIVSSLALAACAFEIASDRRAAAVAALALSLAPLLMLPFGTASPDGPYLMFWALALWFGTRAFKRDRTADWILLGAMLGGGLLSRVFGLALLLGVIVYASTGGRAVAWRRGMPIAIGVALAVCLPFLVWNSTHDWVTLRFALFYRHEATAVFSLPRAFLIQLGAYSPGIWIAVLVCMLRPRNALLGWTAIPQFAIVMLASFRESVEVYWLLGFFVSMAAMLAIAYTRLGRRARAIWGAVTVVPAALLLVPVFTFLLAPAWTWQIVQSVHFAQPRNNGPFEIMTYSMVADDAARLARERDAIVMTDGYGFSSVMDFDAGSAPVVIGYNWQGRESRGWYPDSNHPARALFVDKEPLASRPDFGSRLRRACAKVSDGGVHGYSYGDTAPRNYYFTWCEGLKPDGLAILRWEREGVATSRPPQPAASPVPPWTVTQRAELTRALDDAFAGGILAEKSAVAVVSADGRTLYARRAGVPMTPASTLKLVIAATALDVLGAERRFESTFVALAPPDEAGVLHGPLWFVGGGDPLFTSDELRGGIGALRRLGVRRIDGPIVVDGSAFAGAEQNARWDPADLEEGYAAATSALSLDQGTVEFRVTPGTPGDAARVTIEPPNENVEFGGSIVTSDGATSLHIERRPEFPSRNVFTVRGTIAPGAMQKFWKPVLGIPAYVGGAIVALAAQQGIEVSGGVRAGAAPLTAVTLWLHRSPPLSAIVGEMLVHSNNHSAEQLLRLVGQQAGRAGTDQNGFVLERRELARLGIAHPGLTAYDGSGLAPADKIPAMLTARLLAAELRGPNGRVFLLSLPRVALDGTVVYGHELHAALGRARAKSGHLKAVNALAGTVLTRRHGRIAFAFVVNDRRSEASAVYRSQDRALDALSEF